MYVIYKYVLYSWNLYEIYRSVGRVNDEADEIFAMASEHLHHEDATVDQQAFLGKAGMKEFGELSPHEARERLRYVYTQQPPVEP